MAEACGAALAAPCPVRSRAPAGSSVSASGTPRGGRRSSSSSSSRSSNLSTSTSNSNSSSSTLSSSSRSWRSAGGSSSSGRKRSAEVWALGASARRQSPSPSTTSPDHRPRHTGGRLRVRCQAGPGGERKEPAVAVSEDDVSSRREEHTEGGLRGQEGARGAQGAEEQPGGESGKASEGEAEEESRVAAGGEEGERVRRAQEDLWEAERRMEQRKQAVQRALKSPAARQGDTWAGGGIGGTGGGPGGPLGDLLSLARDSLGMKLEGIEQPGMEKLDLQKLQACFTFSDFWATEARRYGTGGLFTGNLRGDVEEVRAKLEPKLSEAAGVPVVLFFLVDDVGGKQVLVVQPQAEVRAREANLRMRGLARWPLAVLGALACTVTTAGIAGVSFDPFGTGQGPELLLQFMLGLAAVIGVGEMFERIMAERYGVQLSPPYLIPGPLGCLGCATRFESVVPSRQALLDIAAARAVGSLVTALFLAGYALVSDGGVSGGVDPLYVQPQFFEPNFLVSFVQYVIGPYADELGNVMPNAVEGVGVPVNPLAFAGLLGLINTALSLLPAGQLEGGRIAQAVLGRRKARRASSLTILALGIGGVSGSVLCLVWGFVVLFFRNGPELPCAEEVGEIGKWRVFLAAFLLGAALFLLLPNAAGTFPSFFLLPEL